MGTNAIKGFSRFQPIPIKERFWPKVLKTDACWLWQAPISRSGYGEIHFEGKTILAHRLAYEWEHGTIPEELKIDHLCRTTACVRPSHLEVVTHQENLRRGRHPNVGKTHCFRGHPLSGENVYQFSGGHLQRQCRVCHRVVKKAYKLRKREVIA